jgi:hypothetical protein
MKSYVVRVECNNVFPQQRPWALKGISSIESNERMQQCFVQQAGSTICETRSEKFEVQVGHVRPIRKTA